MYKQILGTTADEMHYMTYVKLHKSTSIFQ